MLSPEDGQPYGYFPMRLGQTLDEGKYMVVRKLGYGTHSSMWLAKEIMPDGHCYVVIKVLSVAATYAECDELCYESAVATSMATFQTSDTTHPGFRHCATIREAFIEESAHGEHFRVVLPPYGTSLRDILETSPTCRFALRTVKRVTRQVLLGLSFLQSRLQRVHTDVKLANILVDLGASTEQIDSFLANDPPQIYADSPPINPQISPHPIPAVRSQPLPNFGLDPTYENLHIRLIDYGNAIRADDISPDTFICTPTDQRAPEMLLGHAWSYPVEVWAVGCLIFQMLTRRAPFPPYTGDDHLAVIYDRLGPFPMDFVRRCRHGEELVDSQGTQDLSDLCRFLRKCFTIDPLMRPTVPELLADAWLVL
ncbi:kinase-like protein [Trametes versicolor FP-101664 SS1]|uniref:kinase-like protein n=1 Tax=Trametes versicolor (strain FP-101664) TaxID=717944 RepID=UPI00046247A0|nr:kinase-like protein [Trametes versicolor FP-101664 SS1]EIW55371.1 kinase-like protein [Trametes versicolor FP-101664 SS1]